MKNKHKSGCCVCGQELIYRDKSGDVTCFYCGKKSSSNVTCPKKHYVCDSCHASSANDLIEKLCISTSSTNPLELAISIMNHPNVKMHGPEHHFLIPAVLLASYYNERKIFKDKEAKIKEARRRAEMVPGGFCGSHGDCGAAVGVGIFVSIVTGSNSLSQEEWKESNLMTAKALAIIAKHGGPRCCKRNTFLAIETIMEHLGTPINKRTVCSFNEFNEQCKKKQCPYFKN